METTTTQKIEEPELKQILGGLIYPLVDRRPLPEPTSQIRIDSWAHIVE
jgi:hypothetical protein